MGQQFYMAGLPYCFPKINQKQIHGKIHEFFGESNSLGFSHGFSHGSSHVDPAIPPFVRSCRGDGDPAPAWAPPPAPGGAGKSSNWLELNDTGKLLYKYWGRLYPLNNYLIIHISLWRIFPNCWFFFWIIFHISSRHSVGVFFLFPCPIHKWRIHRTSADMANRIRYIWSLNRLIDHPL